MSFQISVTGSTVEAVFTEMDRLVEEYFGSGAAPSMSVGEQLSALPAAVVPAVPIAALPPTSPAAVLPPPAAAVVPAGGVELDTKGLPWDERIHSANKGKNADGSWRSKRGVQEAFKTQVEAELRAKSAGAVVVSVASVPAVVPAPVIPAGFTETPAAAVPPPSAPVAPVTVVKNAAAIVGLISSKKLDVQSQIQPFLVQLTLNSLTDIFTRASDEQLAWLYDRVNELPSNP